MIDPVVRAATVDDVGILEDLSTQARDSIKEARGGTRWLETHPRPQWDDLGRTVLVAELDGLVVGYLVGRMGTGEVMTVDEVFVREECRELGFGDALVEEVRRIAVRSGARRLEAEALPGDRETKNLWERAGITARLITVSVEL